MFKDDGIAVSILSKRENKSLKKEICRIFKEEGLDITININFKVVDVLDVELNLSEETHWPYTKLNDTILYKDSKSNHPQNMKKKHSSCL